MTIWITVRIQESEVRNPDSVDNQKSYQQIFMKFYGELGCALETNWLHFGDDLHHYLDPGVRSGSRSGSRKNCHVVITHRNRWRSRAWPRDQVIKYWWRSASASGSRSLKFGFTGLSKKYLVDLDQSCIANLHCKNHLAILLCWLLAEVCALWVLLVL